MRLTRIFQYLKELIHKNDNKLLKEIRELKKLTIKNQNNIMAALSDFQAVANEISTATQNISTYVQGAGMSATDQDIALKAIQDAVTGLNAAIPSSEVPVEQPTT